VGGGYKPLNEIERLQSGFFINSDHAAIGLMLFPELENIYSKEVANRRPKKSEDIHQLQQNLCNKLDKIPQFEEIAPVLYGCILLRASKYWESRLMIHNLQAAGLM
jgi:hypothetical protein